MPRRDIPEVNASSLADIAFLLLTFFLVATTLNKPSGLFERLPDPTLVNLTEPAEVEKQNVMLITIDDNNVFKINDKPASIEDIKPEVLKHLNNGRIDCDYCVGGKKLATYADNPREAIVQLKRTNASTLGVKIAILGEIESAYNEARNAYTVKKYGRTFKSIESYRNKVNNGNIGKPDELTLAMYDDVNEKWPKKIVKPDPKETL